MLQTAGNNNAYMHTHTHISLSLVVEFGQCAAPSNNSPAHFAESILDAMEELEKEAYVCNAAQALKIRLISNEKELDGTFAPHKEFHPEFTHQARG